ncbi:MAG TPA: hypothetical protein VGL02_10175, partial [Streptomyces sp.]
MGRERELEGLRGDIGRAGLGAKGSRRVRVLLVAGRPGAGRTAVALRLAADVAGRYQDGRFFARLTGDDGEPVPAAQTARTLLRAMGTPSVEDIADPAQALRAAAADRRMLFVLDDVLRADQLADLLPDAPDSLVVATSDGPLSGIPDVRPCTLGGLDTPAAVELLAHLIGPTRVTCDPRAAETLVQELGGHPTALRLVASWLATLPRLSVADAATRLRATSGEPPTPSPARASTPGELVRAFRLVYDELPPTAARMLRLLALAPAGMVDAQVASALAGCSVTAAQSTLDDFVTGALLTATASVPAAPPPQYRVPGCLDPMLRALLEARDRPEDVRLARARMLERTVRLLQTCRAALAGEAPEAQEDGGAPTGLRFGSRAAAADWLRSRLPALLASARAAVADGELDTLARRLVAVLVQALTAFPGAG